MTTPEIHDRRAGFTLLEVMIASSILAGILYTVSVAMTAGSQTVTTLSTSSEQTADASRILHDIAMELRSVDQDYAYDASNANESTLSFNTCSYLPQPGAEARGEPLVPLFTNHREVIHDKTTGELRKLIVNTDPITGLETENYEMALATNVAPDGFQLEHLGTEDTIQGNRVLLRLTLRDDVNGRDHDTTVERIVFIRSFLFNYDDRGSDPITDEAYSTPNGPRIIWGEDQHAGDTTTDQFLIIVKLRPLDGYTLRESGTLVEFLGDSTSFNMEPVQLGWLTEAEGLQDDEIRIRGTVTGSLGIKITAQAISNGVTSELTQTIERNFY